MGKEIVGIIQELREIIEGSLVDAEKFDKGNKAAGVRVRKAMQESKKQAQAIRVAVSEAK